MYIYLINSLNAFAKKKKDAVRTLLKSVCINIMTNIHLLHCILYKFYSNSTEMSQNSKDLKVFPEGRPIDKIESEILNTKSKSGIIGVLPTHQSVSIINMFFKSY